MRASSLPNLRGLISNGAQMKVQIVKAINQASLYAKRGPGYAPAAQSLYEALEAGKAAILTYTRADSIAATPATDTLDASNVETQQITTVATFPDGETLDVSADTRVTYSSSDATKATVSSTGLITAVAAGSTTITVTFQGRTDTIAVTVVA